LNTGKSIETLNKLKQYKKHRVDDDEHHQRIACIPKIGTSSAPVFPISHNTSILTSKKVTPVFSVPENHNKNANGCST
jgi:hypothetical protein